ncbi:hypothetical protein [Candidatus Hamiltonella defensa]|uniref:hypothetical protein n=1 Tax=Candidatus Williamhamiltonella defendens TaxID=138072 RepID=UPI001314B6AB
MRTKRNLLESQRNNRFIELTESNAFIIKKTPDGLSCGECCFLRASKVFNRRGQWGCGCHVLFNQTLITPVEAGIDPVNR